LGRRGVSYGWRGRGMYDSEGWLTCDRDDKLDCGYLFESSSRFTAPCWPDGLHDPILEFLSNHEAASPPPANKTATHVKATATMASVHLSGRVSIKSPHSPFPFLEAPRAVSPTAPINERTKSMENTIKSSIRLDAALRRTYMNIEKQNTMNMATMSMENCKAPALNANIPAEIIPIKIECKQKSAHSATTLKNL